MTVFSDFLFKFALATFCFGEEANGFQGGTCSAGQHIEKHQIGTSERLINQPEGEQYPPDRDAGPDRLA